MSTTPDGEIWPHSTGIDVKGARRCPNWTERRPHLAGALGAALLSRLVELEWVVRQPKQRTVDLTPAGQHGLARMLGLQF